MASEPNMTAQLAYAIFAFPVRKEDVTIRSRSGSYNSSTSSVSFTKSDFTAKAKIKKFTEKEINDSQGKIISSDLKLILLNNHIIDYSLSEIIIGGEIYSIKSFDFIDNNNLVKLQVRK